MKTISRKILAFLTVAVLVGVASVSLAGNLEKVGPNKNPGAGLKDATTGVHTQSTAERGIRWIPSTATAFSTVATNSSQALTVTGGSTNYAGPYFVAVANNGAQDLAVFPAESVTAVTTFLAVKIVKAGYSDIVGPFSPTSTHVHVLGVTGTAQGATLTLGTLE